MSNFLGARKELEAKTGLYLDGSKHHGCKLWRLHFELGWPKELLGTQSIDYAFDVTAYVDADSKNEYIACEVKKTVREMDAFKLSYPDDGLIAFDEALIRDLRYPASPIA